MDSQSSSSKFSDQPSHHSDDITHFDTLANRLTALRILLVPIVVVLLLKPDPILGFWAAIAFGIAGITDYFDGYYARTRQAITLVGKLLDPLADKFLVVSSLIMLMHLDRIHSVIVILLVCREIAITGLRAIASAEGIVIAASNLAKWKTTAQMSAIPMLMLETTFIDDFFQNTLHVSMRTLGTILIWISLAISLWSARDYLVDFFKTVRARARARREERRAQKLARLDP